MRWVISILDPCLRSTGRGYRRTTLQHQRQRPCPAVDGCVWCNPPFGREAAKWMRKMVAHGDGIVLIPARTETADVLSSASGVLLMRCCLSRGVRTSTVWMAHVHRLTLALRFASLPTARKLMRRFWCSGLAAVVA